MSYCVVALQVNKANGSFLNDHLHKRHMELMLQCTAKEGSPDHLCTEKHFQTVPVVLHDLAD